MLKFIQGLVVILALWIKCLVLFWIPHRFRYKKDVEGDVVLVTGGGNGLGRLLVIAFARLGAKVVIWDVDTDGAKETCKLTEEFALKPVIFYKCDVADRNEVRLMSAKVKKEIGSVTILINNAAIAIGKYFPDLTEDEIEKVFKVNILSNFWTCKAFLPDMRSSNHGHLVTISSGAGLVGCVKLSDYSATKHALMGFHETLSWELMSDGYDGVKTTIVCPGYFDTGRSKGIGKTPMEISPEFVAESVMNGILTNEKLVLVPRFMNLNIMFKALAPTAVYMKILELSNYAHVMKNFRMIKNCM